MEGIRGFLQSPLRLPHGRWNGRNSICALFFSATNPTTMRMMAWIFRGKMRLSIFGQAPSRVCHSWGNPLKNATCYGEIFAGNNRRLKPNLRHFAAERSRKQARSWAKSKKLKPKNRHRTCAMSQKTEDPSKRAFPSSSSARD